MSPELSIIIPTHNRHDLLRGCLESLNLQVVRSEGFEVVVVVDGSTDKTAEMLAAVSTAFSLRMVTQAKAGASAARNAGARAASAKLLLFIDDDMIASPSLVSAHLVAHHGRERIAGVGMIEPRIRDHVDRFAQLRAEAMREHYRHLSQRPLSHLDCYGGNVSVSQSIFDEVGGFAVDLPVLNDFEFAHRLSEAGVGFTFVPDAVVTEESREDWRGIIADRELRGRVAVELHRRDPAIVRQTELTGYEPLTGPWLLVRSICLGLRVSPRLLARVGFLLPRRTWSRSWFAFVFSYAFWRGVTATSGHRGIWRRSRATWATADGG
jgi:glycosyltransferase involved in cell wall biosynthesis